jgi:tetratricopeptide (TPR) repeat protein
VWSSYSARHAAQLIGLTESAVRSCIRDGLIGAPGEVPARLSFRDLAALRLVKALVEGGVPLARVRKQLLELARALPEGRTIAELPLEARGGRVHLRGQAIALEPGQLELPLAVQAAHASEASDASGAGNASGAAERDELPLPLPSSAGPGPGAAAPAAPAGGELLALPRPPGLPGPVAAPVVTADEWLARAVALEEVDPAAAIEAYQRSLRLRPDCSEAWINLGRLHAEADHAQEARQCFRSALEVDPTDATALYNLGVVAQDAGEEADAIALYGRALDIDPALAEAHYNLATLYDQAGDARLAIRHINEYRKLTKA